MMPNKEKKMNDLKQKLKDLEIIKVLKNDLNNEKYNSLDDMSKALLLKSLNDYAFEIDNDIRRHNNNVDLLEDMGIQDEKIIPPKIEYNNLKYHFEDALVKIPFDIQILYLKDLVDMYIRNDYGFADKELQVILKSLKKCAYNMTEMIAKSKNDKEIVDLIDYEQDYNKSVSNQGDVLNSFDTLDDIKKH